jgi:DNA-directed RNA polymerase subunit RPC12/RpoP
MSVELIGGMFMLGLTCAKCGRRFTPSAEEMANYVAQSEGKKYVLVACPHCGKENKVDVHRVQQLSRFGPSAGRAADEAEPEGGAGNGDAESGS